MAASRYPQLEWRESTPGRWEREIDEAEQFYTYMAKMYEGTGRMFFAITGFVSLSVRVSEDSSPKDTGHLMEAALRQAWLRLRFEHPTIASYVDYDPERGKWLKSYTTFYPESADAQIEDWLHATFVPIESRISGPEWCNLDPLAPKLPTLFVINPLGAQEDVKEIVHRHLVIRSPHDIMDGIGTLQLLNTLLILASEAFENPKMWKPPSPGSECRNLSPPLRVAAAVPPILTLQQQDRLQTIINWNTSLRQGVETLTLPFKRDFVVPGKHQRIAHELSIHDTTRLMEACKGIGATVTHVYHAAVACSMRDLQIRGEETRRARYLSYALINERPRCTEPYSTTKHAAAVYHSVSGESLILDLTIPSANDQSQQNQEQLQEEFRILVEQVRAFYHKIRLDTDHIALAPSFFSMATPHISDPTTAPQETPIPAPNESPSVSVSSMGVIDKIIAPQHGRFKIENPWVTGEELGTGFGVFLGTWEGKLQISAAYNDAWHDKDEVDAFLKHCQEVVWKGLHLHD
jgi:hypothetical protein